MSVAPPPPVAPLPQRANTRRRVRRQRNNDAQAATSRDMTHGEAAVRVDGALMEGGGQILRMSIGLSAVLHKPVTVFNVRAGRRVPGLRDQHAAGIRLVGELCAARIAGCAVKSSEVRFEPGRLVVSAAAARNEGDGASAVASAAGATDFPVVASATCAGGGSVGLLAQVVLPPLLFMDRPVAVRLEGGTNASFAPQWDYAQRVFLPLARRFNADVVERMASRGFAPGGGGVVELRVRPRPGPLRAVRMEERGDVTSLHAVAFSAGKCKASAAAEAATKALQVALRGCGSPAAVVKQETTILRCGEAGAVPARGNGIGILVLATTSKGCVLAGSALGSKKTRGQEMGAFAGRMLCKELKHGGTVDEYAMDQIVILMALAEGESRVLAGPLSLHSRTSIHIAAQLTAAEFDVKPAAGGTGSVWVTCKGIGFRRHRSADATATATDGGAAAAAAAPAGAVLQQQQQQQQQS